MRKAGVLLPVSAQMGEFGIGDFGDNAKLFVDFISQIGFKVWQVLPINIIGEGNSPYSGLSSFAGNPLFINLLDLCEFLTEEEINSTKIDALFSVDYEKAKENKQRALKLAYSRLDESYKDNVNKFLSNNKEWLLDYALFMVLRKITNKSWYEWEHDLKFRKKEALDKVKKLYENEIGYYYFEQYLFYKQWFSLKEYANSVGIEIMGDIPIYVSYDSVDVWSNPETFNLDKDLKIKLMSGVPPDYFAEDGQFWGNPIYDYKTLKKDGYKWLVNRIEKTARLYDYLRIDHFRGLYEYWAIPQGAKTAKEGRWEQGPGIELWKELSQKGINDKIIAEDLGIIDEEVVAFRESLGLPGMRVFHFGFDGDTSNTHLPHNYEKNTIAYSATHDNDTTLGWLYSLDAKTRENVLEYINFTGVDWGAGGRDGNGVKAIIRTIMASVANMAIIPFQDLCAYGSDTRTNIPGVPYGNWEYRCTLSSFEDIDVSFLKSIIKTYGR